MVFITKSQVITYFPYRPGGKVQLSFGFHQDPFSNDFGQSPLKMVFGNSAKCFYGNVQQLCIFTSAVFGPVMHFYHSYKLA